MKQQSLFQPGHTPSPRMQIAMDFALEVGRRRGLVQKRAVESAWHRIVKEDLAEKSKVRPA